MKTISLNELLSIWWALTWRTVVFGMLIGMALGAIGGFVMGVLGHADSAGAVGGLMGYLGLFPASIFALKTALAKNYKNFRLDIFRDSIK